MAKTITLSGWAQPADALANIAPGALQLDYMTSSGIEDFLHKQIPAPLECDLLIGWSLGGYVALQALSSKKIKAKRLLLLSTPFQFLASPDMLFGMAPRIMADFISDFRKHPDIAFRRFQTLIAMGDTKEKEIARFLCQQSVLDVTQALHWLEVLEQSTCVALDFASFPPVYIVQGGKDMIVNSKQVEMFVKKLPNVHYEIWPGCAHAPHMHDPEKLKLLMESFS